MMLNEKGFTSSSNSVLKALVKKVLLAPQHSTWQVQGLGMLRTYITKEVRLHIWHDSFQVPGVSTLHTHPWAFTSHVVNGALWNMLFDVHPSAKKPPNHHKALLKCGPGGGLEAAATPVRLVQVASNVHLPGTYYYQDSSQIHETKARNGTVTLVERYFREDEEHAYVFWPIDSNWVSAEPRLASEAEIARGVESALQLMDI